MKTRLLPGLFIAALLIAAQGALSLHAFEHDPGAPQSNVCGTCVTASQLTAGGIDNHAGEPLAPARPLLVATASSGFESRHATPVRQREPPSSS